MLLSAKHSSGTVGGLAYAFINFLYDPAVAAEKTTFLKYLCPNRDAYGLLPEDLRKNPGVFISPEIRAKSEIIADLGAANALSVKVWDEIKAAKQLRVKGGFFAPLYFAPGGVLSPGQLKKNPFPESPQNKRSGSFL